MGGDVVIDGAIIEASASEALDFAASRFCYERCRSLEWTGIRVSVQLNVCKACAVLTTANKAVFEKN